MLLEYREQPTSVPYITNYCRFYFYTSDGYLYTKLAIAELLREE